MFRFPDIPRRPGHWVHYEMKFRQVTRCGGYHGYDVVEELNDWIIPRSLQNPKFFVCDDPEVV